MSYLFRINKTLGSSKSTIVDWSNSQKTPYNHGFVEKIQDTTTTQKEITSIPSPFARIELVKEAFGKIVPESLNNKTKEQVEALLHGKSIYHKMVSDSLDVGQIFFSYPIMKDDKIEIKVWKKDKCLEQLEESNNSSHKIFGSTLRMFFEQDSRGADPYNFGKMEDIYILRYKGTDKRSSMHIIGATSPATLFFSTANDESALSDHLCFGEDYAFDSEYASLDQRDHDYIKYLFAFKYSDPDFSRNYPEVNKYLDAVYVVLDEDLKNELESIQEDCSTDNNYIDKHYDKLVIDVSPTSQAIVEVNGKYLHCKKQPDPDEFESDFVIVPSKANVSIKPLVLPTIQNSVYSKWLYASSPFGDKIKVPFVDKNSLVSRRLPGVGIQIPYLTISDFLDDKIIMLPSEVNKDRFFDGNFSSRDHSRQGYLLPIKPLYFDYFNVEDLMNDAPSGEHTINIKTVASGVEVTLRIPTKKGEVEYKRIYTLDVKADAKNNQGAIVVAPEDFVVGVFPPIKFNNPSDAHYRIAILSDFTLNKKMTCSCYNKSQGFSTPHYVVRNVNSVNDIRSKVYYLEGTDFDCANISIFTDQKGKEKQATGLMIPKFIEKQPGNSIFTFAIDLGTSNTHIEYKTAGNVMPEPFEFEVEQPQISLLFKPSDSIQDHVRAELIPEKIGNNAKCHFPMRTVLSIDKTNSGIDEGGIGSYVPFGNSSPAFMYNLKDIGTSYNEFVPNIKWSDEGDNEEHIRCYIESLFLMIRNKVIQEGGSLSQTQIKWFYPISMSENKQKLFTKVWNEAYKKFFNSNGTPIAITESIAPYSYFQNTMRNVTDVVTIDIGGGTTDIVIADTKGVKCVTSMRFAADAIFGDSLVSVSNGELNGIIKQYKDQFINSLSGFDDLQRMLKAKTANNRGNSSEVASFLFSLSENEDIIDKKIKNKVDFNAILQKDGSQKVVFYLFYTAIIYHLANLMKAKGFDPPVNIAFSGNGSKVISVLRPVPDDDSYDSNDDSNDDTNNLEGLTRNIFKLIYGVDVNKINLIINEENPKQATCKGGLFMNNNQASSSHTKTVLLGSDSSTLVEEQKYADLPALYNSVVQVVKDFNDFATLQLPELISLSKAFGIQNTYIDLAASCFNADLKSYVEKGVDLKLKSKDISKQDIVEETLFFYPIIGVINDLSEKIHIMKLKAK